MSGRFEPRLPELRAALDAQGVQGTGARLEAATTRPLPLAEQALLLALDQALGLHAEVLEEQPEQLAWVVHASLVSARVEERQVEAVYQGSPLPELRLRHPVVLPALDRAQLAQVEGPVLCLASSPGHAWLAASTPRGGVRLWSPHTLQPAHTLESGPAQVLCLAWIDQAQLLARGGGRLGADPPIRQ